jgi:plastocyanin
MGIRGTPLNSHAAQKELEVKSYAPLKLAFAFATVLLLITPSAFAVTHIVTVGDNFFSPANLTIQVGDTVEWRNAAGGMSHDVTANNGSFASVTATSFTFSQTFNTAGSISYFCTVHPNQMTGVITVQGAPPPEPELAVTEVSVMSGSYAQGSMISIDTEVQNVGNASSGSFSIKHYASDNSTITAQDTLLGTENRASLEANEDSNGPFNAMIPANLAPGSYFIGSILDFNDANSANNNNSDDEPITVTEASSFQINAGLNDAWFNPETDGQGFFVTVFPTLGKMFLGWFTYDVELPGQGVTAIIGGPGQRWITAFGDISGDTATLEVDLVTGGIFDSADPVPSHTPDGTIIIVFSDDCMTAELTHDITAANVSGVIPIQRISNDNVPLCEALK